MTIKLNDYEQDMLAGRHGKARQFGMQQIVKVGDFFDAADCVEISQVHIMADTESLGASGVGFLEELAVLPEAERRVKVPTITDPRGMDFAHYQRLGQSEQQADWERRTIAAFRRLGILLTDTCINYQTIMPPLLGEHLAFGDTGSSIYANSVQGARTNFQGGPSALAAALTGRVPRYGFHLDECRRGRRLFEVEVIPGDLAEWGALGGIIGGHMTSYWEVPVILLPVDSDHKPSSDQLKQFGAALASYGSTALFHMPGITPEAPDLASVFDGTPPAPVPIAKKDTDGFMQAYRPDDDKLDVVVFAAPQLSLLELQTLAGLLDGRHIHKDISLLVATSPEIKSAADRMGLTETIESAGGTVLKGVCFYQMCAREMGEAMGWRRLLSNSAKLVNIIGGYGYQPVLAPMEHCVESAVAGRLL